MISDRIVKQLLAADDTADENPKPVAPNEAKAVDHTTRPVLMERAAYLKQMADHFASLRPPFPAPAVPTVSNDVLARGEALVKEGDPKNGIPPCSACHGPSLGGMEPAIPGLLGLRASYISAQLGGWRYGTRTAAAPDCMQIVAGLLTEDDVKAVAAYLSSRPAPKDPSFAPRGSLPMPLECGSQPR